MIFERPKERSMLLYKVINIASVFPVFSTALFGKIIVKFFSTTALNCGHPYHVMLVRQKKDHDQ